MPSPATPETAASPGTGVEPLGAPLAAARSTLRFTFTGNAGDYFRIWIVNLLLTILTLGVWSAWAKVRKLRYLYGHTWLASCNFEYHGKPNVILRGRLLAVLAIGTYWLLDNLLPGLAPWLLLALGCGAPWIIARSLAFNAANSSHRNVRFRFEGTTRDVALAIWPVVACIVGLIVFSGDPMELMANPLSTAARIGLVYIAFIALYPYVVGKVRQLIAGRSAWGNQSFRTTMSIRSIYAIYFIGGVLSVGLGIVAFIPVGIAIFLAANLGSMAAIVVSLLSTFVSAGVFVVWVAFLRSRMWNLMFNTTRLSNIARLRSAVSTRALARIYMGNLVAILFSLGLLIPWAVVRVARYRLQAMSVEIESPLARVAAMVTQSPGAAGQEFADVFGIDLAL